MSTDPSLRLRLHLFLTESATAILPPSISVEIEGDNRTCAPKINIIMNTICLPWRVERETKTLKKTKLLFFSSHMTSSRLTYQYVFHMPAR